MLTLFLIFVVAPITFSLVALSVGGLRYRKRRKVLRQHILRTGI